LAEQLTLNQWVPGSSPGGCTENPVSSHESWIFFILGMLSPEAQNLTDLAVNHSWVLGIPQQDCEAAKNNHGRQSDNGNKRL
jgi:hypothetical protein